MMSNPWRDGRAVAGLVLASVIGVAGCGAHSFRATEVLVLTASANEADRLEVNSQVGDVRVVGRPGANTVTARVTKVGRGVSPAEARAALAEIEVFLQTGSEGLEAGVRHPHHSMVRSWETQWDIDAPPRLALEIRTNVGEIGARDVDSGVVASTDVGDINFVNVRGGVVAAADVGDIRAEEVAGGARLEANVGDIQLSFVSPSAMPVQAVTDVGSVRVDLSTEQKGRLTAKVGVGSLRVDLGQMPMTNLQHSVDSLGVDLRGSNQPDMVMRTSVGDVTVLAR